MESLAKRTKGLALRVIRLYCALPTGIPAAVIGRQMLRSGTSVGAHCREAFRRRSDAEFISKLQVALQELDEASYWMELLVEGGIVPAQRLEPLMKETHELMAILVASIRTIKKNRPRFAS